ncbi:hypothetical protein AB0395_16405 [Streptosporangium sp. NPDC051023]|uniref:hypothetical protein n=1 Tax=Streptosporangium sp. NPDC051023 TaxID=3155410 RepID=UPI00344D4EFF
MSEGRGGAGVSLSPHPFGSPSGSTVLLFAGAVGQLGDGVGLGVLDGFADGFGLGVPGLEVAGSGAGGVTLGLAGAGGGVPTLTGGRDVADISGFVGTVKLTSPLWI